MKESLEKVTSRDGTPIGYYRSGSGSPLVIVAGTGAANPIAWTSVFSTLEKHFSVYTLDRRGRGESGDSHTYAIEREFEDIAAVVDSIGEPVYLLGHSFGALCALEATLLTHNIRKLILYEPAIRLSNEPIADPDTLSDRIQALLDAGNREGVLITFYREAAGMSSHEIEQMRSSPAWPERLALAHTLPREIRAEERYRFDAQRFRDLPIPTLLLIGGDSPRSLKEVTETVATALPDMRIAVMPGQQHIAMYTAPDLFLHEILTFCIA